MRDAAKLRARAVAHTLFPHTTLARAIARLRFVQADPIHAPAPAQDLILRHRVRDYARGDLERRFAKLAVEEDYLYAYGFTARDVAHALHPRARRALSAFERRVLDVVGELGRAHPSDVSRVLGDKRVTNAWGGQSRATTHALDSLQYRGALRVARRDRGVRVYELAKPHDAIAPLLRLRTLVLAITNVLAPIRERTLRSNVTRFRHLGDPGAAIDALIADGSVTRNTVDAEPYLSPPVDNSDEPPRVVRFLAPFDPLVWDRKRFEHLWGWRYRFEAYTPVRKRVRGYYAMPLLFGADVIGWANVDKGAVSIGFAGSVLRDTTFKSSLEEEIVRIRTF